MSDIFTRLDYRTAFTPELLTNPCLAAMSPEIGCRKCIDACPYGAITRHWGTLEINADRCHYCGRCYEACPGDVIGIKGLDNVLVTIKNDRQRGTTVLYPVCDRQTKHDIQGSFQVPNLRYLSSEFLFWTAALGYQKIVISGIEKCKDCKTECLPVLLKNLEKTNNWLASWGINLELSLQEGKPNTGVSARTMSRRELFKGLRIGLSREVTSVVAEEVASRLKGVLPRTEQGYVRRQQLLALAVRLLGTPSQDGWVPLVPVIDDGCGGCTVCSQQCPTRALVYGDQCIIIKPWLCNACGFCVSACGGAHIKLVPLENAGQYFSSHRHLFAPSSSQP